MSATEGASTGTVQVASFSDANPNATLSDYTATINWGDGTSHHLGHVGGGQWRRLCRRRVAYLRRGRQLHHQRDDQRRRRQHGDHEQHRHGCRCGADGSRNDGRCHRRRLEQHRSGCDLQRRQSECARRATTPRRSTGAMAPPSPGYMVAVNGGGFAVERSHTYAEEGTYTISMTSTTPAADGDHCQHRHGCRRGPDRQHERDGGATEGASTSTASGCDLHRRQSERDGE